MEFMDMDLAKIFLNQKILKVSTINSDKEGEPFMVVFTFEGEPSKVAFKCVTVQTISESSLH
jgi:hypothetical protein